MQRQDTSFVKLQDHMAGLLHALAKRQMVKTQAAKPLAVQNTGERTSSLMAKLDQSFNVNDLKPLTAQNLPPLKSFEKEDYRTRHTNPDAPIAKRKRPKRRKIVVRKPGFMGSVLKPFAVAFAWLFAVWGTTAIYTNYTRSFERHQNYNKVHVDQTAIDLFRQSHVPSDQIQLVVRDFDGQVQKVAASKTQLKALLHKMDADLTKAHEQIQADQSHDINALFETVFADKTKAVNAYADWFFEWKRSYIVLKETMTSAVARVMDTGRYETFKEAVGHDVKDYFMKHYKEQVLKPQLRDSKLREGFEQIARRSHKTFREAALANDAQMRQFLLEKTSYLDKVPAHEQLTQVKLDWDTQKWNAPSYLIEDKAMEGLVGVGRTAASGAVGALLLGPATGRIMSQVFGGLSTRFVTSVGSRLAFTQNGAIAGTAVEPGGGTFVGATVGFLLGTAADYFINKANEKFNREKFVKANEQAMEQTIAVWQGKMGNSLKTNVDSWFHHAKAGLILPRLDGAPLIDSRKPLLSVEDPHHAAQTKRPVS